MEFNLGYNLKIFLNRILYSRAYILSVKIEFNLVYFGFLNSYKNSIG
jgi:hypothetical protein